MHIENRLAMFANIRIFKLVVLTMFLLLSSSIIAEATLELGYLEPFSEEFDLMPRVSQKNDNFLKLQMTPGEYESVAFYLISDSDLGSVEVALTKLHKGSDVIAESNFDLKHVAYWYQSGGAWESIRVDRKKENMLVPELLVNDPRLVELDHDNRINLVSGVGERKVKLSGDVIEQRKSLDGVVIRDADKLLPASLKANTPNHYFLTIQAPDDSAPGIYNGHVVARSGDIERRFNIAVEILPFTLNESPLTYSLYYRGKLKYDQTEISSEWKNEKQLYLELKDMKEHGVCCPTNYQRIFPKTSDGSIEENVTLFRKHMEIRKSVGIDNDRLYYLGLLAGDDASLKDLNVFKDKVDFVSELASDVGVKTVFYYGKEERPADGYNEQLAAWEVVRKTGNAVFVALSDRYFEKNQIAVPEIFVYHNDISLENAKKVKILGSEILSYANPQVGVENPALYRSNYGFNLIKNGFDGVMNYAYQDSMGVLWVDGDHRYYRDHVFAYPSSDGVISTIAWEAFREAVDDTRYYYYALELISKIDIPDSKKYRIELDKIMEDFDASDFNSANRARKELVGLISMIGGG